MRKTLLAFGLTLTLFAPVWVQEAQRNPLIARQITVGTASRDLFGGSDADGGVGDWYLSNGVVEAIVDNIGFQSDVLQATGRALPIQNEVAPTGGTLIDLGLVGLHNDQLDSNFHVLNFSQSNPILYVPAGVALGNPALPPVIARESDDMASLTVFGFALLEPSTPSNPVLVAMTEYSVRRGENFIRVKTTITNRSNQPVLLLSIVDAIVMANNGNLPYAVYPGRGFNHPVLDISNPLPAIGVYPYVGIIGRISPDDGVVDTTDMTTSGEVSYTVVSPENQALVGVNSDLVSATGNPPLADALDPGAGYTYERRIIVGDRNDVASSGNFAVEQLGPVYRYRTGRVRGRLVARDNLPFRANVELTLLDLDPSTPQPETLLSLLIGDDNPLPMTQVRVNSSDRGTYQALLPAGLYQLKVTAEERSAVAPIEVIVKPGEITTVDPIGLSTVGRLQVQVRDAGQPGQPGIPSKIVIKGRNGTPDPRFGNPIEFSIGGRLLPTQAHHASPVLNVVYTSAGAADLALRPGDYRVYASRGLEYDIDFDDVTIGPGQTGQVDLTIKRVVDTSGFVSGDFHIHGVKSPDSSVPAVDRVVSFAATGVEVMVSTDHDFLFDYLPIIREMGLNHLITAMVGDEVTSALPFGPFSSGVGHFSGWPLQVNPTARKDGAPDDEFVEPNVIYDRLRAIGAEVVQVNHPESSSNGLLELLGYDPARAITASPNNFLLRPAITGTGTRNIDFDVVEIYNGTSIPAYLLTRLSWFSLLNQGLTKTGTAVTDTHRLVVDNPGFPRTYVASDVTDLRSFSPSDFNRNLKAMRAFGTSGPILDVRASAEGRTVGMGETLSASGPVTVRVRVQAAPWIPVDEIRFYENGRLIGTFACPPATSVVRFDGGIQIQPRRDASLVVEAGQKLPADPRRQPPSDDLVSIIEPDVVSLAFANPIFIDVNGNGVYDPPGVTGSMLAQQRMRRMLKRSLAEKAAPHLEEAWHRFHIAPEALRAFRERLVK